MSSNTSNDDDEDDEEDDDDALIMMKTMMFDDDDDDDGACAVAHSPPPYTCAHTLYMLLQLVPSYFFDFFDVDGTSPLFIFELYLRSTSALHFFFI